MIGCPLPREVVWWALRYLGVDEWIVSVIEKYLVNSKYLWMTFVDLVKAFDRVPWKVVWWVLRYLGVDE